MGDAKHRSALQLLPAFQTYEGLLSFSAVYLLLGIAVLVRRWDELPTVVEAARYHGRSRTGDGASPVVQVAD